MMRNICRQLGYVLTWLLITAYAPDAAAITPCISDTGEAMRYCKETTLDGIEGIWEFTDDETLILVKRQEHGGKGYDIIVTDTPDCRLQPGDKIGSLERSAKRDTYKMKLFIRRDMGLLTDSRTCLAQYSAKDDAIIVEPMKINISMRTMWFLPRFWRSLKMKVSNPAAEIPKGLIKIYPVSKPSKPIYL